MRAIPNTSEPAMAMAKDGQPKLIQALKANAGLDGLLEARLEAEPGSKLGCLKPFSYLKAGNRRAMSKE